jgi:hypothetical protein
MPDRFKYSDAFRSILPDNIRTRVSVRRLSVLNYADTFTMWFYKVDGDGEMSDLYRKGYFDDAKRMIREGDMIYVRTRLECGNYQLTQLFFPAGVDKPFTIMARG